MKKSVLLFLISINLASTQSIAQDKPLSKKTLQQLDEAEKAMVNAITNGDSVAFKKIAGFDYIDINATGTEATLQSMLNEMQNFKGITVHFSEQFQRIYGNFVLKNGKAKFSLNGQLVGEVFYTQGWVYRDKKWQFVHWQGTMTKDFLQKK
jgi:hypothetical protein